MELMQLQKIRVHKISILYHVFIGNMMIMSRYSRIASVIVTCVGALWVSCDFM